jgi:diphthamide biosynthesis methyltransferase
MFYIIGLGLSDEKDVTVRGLEVILHPDASVLF